MPLKLQMVSVWELQIFQPLMSYSLSNKQISNIRRIVCTGLHITELSVEIKIIDYKTQNATLLALDKISGDFLRIYTVNLNVH